MLGLPDDVVEQILYYSKEETIINLSTISKQIRKIIDDPRFWCQRLIVEKKYDDFTFCYQYNNDEIVYHRSCIDRSSIGINQIPSLAGLSYDVNTIYDLWNVIKYYLNYDQFVYYIKNLTDGKSKIYHLAKNLLLCFDWSPHKINLYRTFSGSILGFYKVLLSAFNWNESCRYVNTKPVWFDQIPDKICGNDTYIFSPFCKECLRGIPINKLLENSINKTGPYHLSPFDKIKKREYIFKNGKRFYCDINDNYIIHLENNFIYCIGKLEGHNINAIKQSDILPAIYTIDTRIYDFVNYNNVEVDLININFDVMEYLKIDGTQTYIDKTYNFIVITEEGTIICLGKLQNKVICQLDQNDKIIAEHIGLLYSLDVDQQELVMLINSLTNK